MTARVAALYRHPVKGFTPEPVASAELVAGGFFPDDRLYAVENGPSGFDPAAPKFISKSRFTVLAQIPGLARLHTRYDEGRFSASAPDGRTITADLRDEAGRAALSDWLTEMLDPDDLRGPLKVVSAPGWRFTDHPEGHVSLMNLASVEALGRRMDHPLDPRRFRSNIEVEGLEPWAEMDWAPGRRIALGSAEVEVFKLIVRCAATHADPRTGERDADVLDALRTHEGHIYCGLYVRVTKGGAVRPGDPVEIIP